MRHARSAGVVVVALLIAQLALIGAPFAEAQVVGVITNATAQPANGASALVRWVPPAPAAEGYLLQTLDVTSGVPVPLGSVTCWACTSKKITGLTVGRQYRWTITPVAFAAPTIPAGPPAMTNVMTSVPNTLPNHLTSVTAVVKPGHIIELSWNLPTTGQAADQVALWAWSSAGQAGRLVLVDIDAPAKQFHVTTGGYVFLAAAFNSNGYSNWKNTGIVNVDKACATADICVDVEPNGTATQTLAAQGFIGSTRSIDAAYTPLDFGLTSAIKPKQWRVGAPQYAMDVAPYGAVRTFLMSDAWRIRFAPNSPATPWSNWDAYRAAVTQTVVNVKASGAGIEYWELFNEPDNLNCCGYFSTADQASATTANVLQTLARHLRGDQGGRPECQDRGAEPVRVCRQRERVGRQDQHADVPRVRGGQQHEARCGLMA